jgi:hypothetical protein
VDERGPTRRPCREQGTSPARRPGAPNLTAAPYARSYAWQAPGRILGPRSRPGYHGHEGETVRDAARVASRLARRRPPSRGGRPLWSRAVPQGATVVSLALADPPAGGPTLRGQIFHARNGTNPRGATVRVAVSCKMPVTGPASPGSTRCHIVLPTLTDCVARGFSNHEIASVLRPAPNWRPNRAVAAACGSDSESEGGRRRSGCRPRASGARLPAGRRRCPGGGPAPRARGARRSCPVRPRGAPSGGRSARRAAPLAPRAGASAA